MWRFGLKAKALVLLLVLSIDLLAKASRPKRQADDEQPPIALSTITQPLLKTDSGDNKFCGRFTATVPRSATNVGAWPWMAAIFAGPSLRAVSCGGVLISEQYVLTASQCIIDKATGQKRNISEYTIRLGELDINDKNDGARPIDLSAAALIPHEGYNRSTFENDIALIKLNRKVSFTGLISPICLPLAPPMSDDLYKEQRAMLSGWGTMRGRGEFTSVLQDVAVTVHNNSRCYSNHHAYTEFKGSISSTQLCAEYFAGGEYSCVGDVGGPLMFPTTNNTFYSIGILSSGVNCSLPAFPSIYTRTTSYIDWIKKNANIQLT